MVKINKNSNNVLFSVVLRCFLPILISTFLLTGCSISIPKSLIFSEEIDLNDSIALLVVNNSLICYKEIAVSNEQSLPDFEYFVVDLDSMEWNSLGIIKKPSTSSGDVLYAPDGNFYLSYQTASHPVALYKLDISSKDINLVYESKSSLPFQFLSILDEDNLVLFEPDSTDEGYVYRVIKYHLSTEKTDVVYKLAVTKDGDEVINSAFGHNGKIYCLISTIGGDYRIDVLNNDGSIDRTIHLDSDILREASSAHGTEYGIWRMYITDDIAWFKTLANTVAPFSLSTGSLCGEILKSYVIDVNLSNPKLSNTLFHRNNKSEIIMFANKNGTLEHCNFTIEKDGKKVLLFDAYHDDSQNKICVIQKNDDGNTRMLMYELK